MDERSRSGLEFAGILAALHQRALTPLGKERAGWLGPLQDVKQVREALTEAAEAQALLERGQDPPFGGVTDIRPHVTQAKVEGTSLDPRSLWQIYETLQAARLLRAFFHGEKEAAPLLWERARGLAPPEALCTMIGEAITPEGEVSDAASPGLHRVRRELRSLREGIVAKLERMLASPTTQPALAEPIITVRNDRYVIPVKASQKGRIRGIVQDQSGSGLTIFLEPTPVVEMNNRLRMLLRQEQEEVSKVLRSLTGEVGRNAERIGAVLERVGDLDLLIAKGRLGLHLRAAVPRVTEEFRLILRQARHPFLVLSPARERVPGEDDADAEVGAVPIDLEVGGTFAVVVISGPNTGGKTVALKTAGLLTLMTLSGLPIPASPDSQVPCYRAVLADIGDEQSIAESLSTFSSHMSQIVKVLARAGPETLILLDELGAGTDPSEGAALGIAVLEAIRQRGASVIATTHLEAVKAYAALTPGVEIASVEFDRERLKPRYSIRLGLPGQSYGLEIAGRLGLPGPILDQAREALPEGHHKAHSIIEALEADRRRVDELRARLQEEVQRASILAREAEELLVRLREGVSALRHRAREEARQLLAELRQQGEGVIRALREQGSRPPEVRAFYRGLEALKGKVEATETPPANGPRGGAEIRPGQWVSILGTRQHGRVLTEVSGQGTVEVELRIGRVHLPVSALSVLSAPPPPRGEVPLFVEKTPSVTREINLIGCSVEEATRRLEKYLDGAFLEGVRQVRVIHGKGTGSLRKAVHTYLASHPLVEGFHLSELYEGGSGATIAMLQDR